MIDTNVDRPFFMRIGDADRLCEAVGAHRGVRLWHLTPEQLVKVCDLTIVPLKFAAYSFASIPARLADNFVEDLDLLDIVEDFDLSDNPRTMESGMTQSKSLIEALTEALDNVMKDVVHERPTKHEIGQALAMIGFEPDRPVNHYIDDDC